MYWNHTGIGMVFCDSQNLAAERSYNNLDITLKEALKHRAPVSNDCGFFPYRHTTCLDTALPFFADF